MHKKTFDLINELLTCSNISEYINDNQDEFIDIPLHIYLKQLLSVSQLIVAQIADSSYKGEYIYQVFRGIKNPSRNVLLSIALAMTLGYEEATRLLYIAHKPLLDPRSIRDSIIIFALNSKLSVPDTNDILFQFNEACL